MGRFIRHEITVLLTLCAVAAGAFLVTRAVARAAEFQKARDAETWYRLGSRNAEDGRVSSAIAALSRASSMDRGRRDYRLALARALAADGQDEAARAILAQLRAAAPEDPEVNLVLARLEARLDNMPAAVSYYRRALYGEWEPDRLGERERLRVELIRYLLQRDLYDRALAELLVLAADLPDDVPQQLETAELLMRAGAPSRALALYTRALRLDGQNAQAIAGAARAAVELGDYSRAQRLLRAADEPTDEIAELLALVDLVRESDPLESRLSAAERRRRVASALAWAANQAGGCALPDGDEAAMALADVQSLQLSLTRTPAADLLGVAEAAVAVLDRIDATLSQVCPPRATTDRAWLLVARRHASGSS